MGNSKIKLTGTVLLFVLPFLIAAQTIKTDGANGTVSVSGTSSLHDWDMKLSTFKASAQKETGDNNTIEISNATFSADANDLSSDNSMMDKKAHKALQAGKKPSISFKQNGKASMASSGKTSLMIRGDLTIAGKTNPVEINLDATINGNNGFSISGKKTIKMTDFDIDPPTAMLGTIKTDDSVTINVDMKLN